jgi:gliding motility-associated-like protein
MKRVILVITLLLSSVCHAQTDTVFWFAAPDLSSRNGNQSEPAARLVFHTYDQPAIITIEQPANSFFPTHTISLPANGQTTDYFMPLYYNSLLATSPANTILNRGLRISSSAPITCYYQTTSSYRETYTLKGRHALGTTFYLLTPVPYQNTPWLENGQSIEIVATEDSTLILITAPNYVDTIRYNEIWWHYNRGTAVFEDDVMPDSTISIMLHRGQSYALRAKHNDTEIIRTIIHASRPIAVNTTSVDCMSRAVEGDTTRHSDIAGEQLVPIAFWGSEYLLFNTHSHSEIFRQLSRSNPSPYYHGWFNLNFNTHYFIDDRWSFNGVGYIHQLDPNLRMGATILPQLDCSGSHQISYLSSDSTSLTIHMTIPTTATDKILFNGDSTVLTAADFSPVPNNPRLSFCVKEVTPFITPLGTLTSAGVINIRCDSAKFLLAVIESDSTRGTSYTYLTDYAPSPKLFFNMDSNYCAGDDITFSFDNFNIDSLRILCPDGSVLSVPPYVISHADTSMSGAYIVEGITHNDCHPVVSDTINIHIFDVPRTHIYDTATSGVLPLSRFGTLFFHTTDTVILRPNPTTPCDSVLHYHLFVLPDVSDTVLYYTCESDLPVQYGDSLFYQEGQGTFLYTGSHGEDSIITFILHIIPSSDTTISDSITEDQLPWFAFDTVFNDTVADYIYHLFNEAGCDSTIHYSLYIFWNGDHCDTALTYPNVVTPNGDGVNDRFVIGGLIEHNCFKYSELTIYDRYGRCVYHKRNIANESDWWNPAAQRAPSGTYFYYFKAHGVNIWTQHRGVIEVLRDK